MKIYKYSLDITESHVFKTSDVLTMIWMLFIEHHVISYASAICKVHGG